MRCLLLSFAFFLPAWSVQADVITDTITQAQTEYEAGNPGAAFKSLQAAMDAIAEQQGAVLSALLPAAPDGYTRTDTADFSAGVARFGGGAGAEAAYVNGDTHFSISVVSDNDIVSGMLGMFSDENMIGMLGKVETVGDVKIISAEDGSLMTIIGQRYMISANGASMEIMKPVFMTIDFAKFTEMAAQ